MDVWVTAIVNEFFRKEFVKQKAEWSMIEKKSFAMVKNKIFGGNLEGKDVIQEASVFFMLKMQGNTLNMCMFW